MLKQLEQDRATQMITRNTLGSLPDYYTKAFDLAVRTRPLLGQTEVVIGTPDKYPILSYTTGFLEDVSKTQPAGPRIVLNDLAKFDLNQLMSDRYGLIQHVAVKLAVPVSRLLSEPDLFHLHTFVHELGHADDYLNRSVLAFAMGLSDEEIAKEFIEQRKEEMSQLPVRMSIQTLLRRHKSGWLNDFFERNKISYQGQGIESITELIKAQEIAYVNSPMEAIAHNFATDLITNNWETFGELLPGLKR